LEGWHYGFLTGRGLGAQKYGMRATKAGFDSPQYSAGALLSISLKGRIIS
jgi:hypothetical protein